MTESNIQNRTQIAAFAMMCAALLFAVHFQLLSALLAGLLVHELVHMLAPRLFRNRDLGRAKIWALLILIAAIVMAVAGLILAIILFLNSEQGNLAVLIDKIAEVLERARETFPASLQKWLPARDSDLGEQFMIWLRGHAQEIQAAGGALGHVLAVSLIGMVIGALVSLREVAHTQEPRYLASALRDCAHRLSDSFRRIVFAQIRISALNTFFTTVFLIIVLPLVGVGYLPLIKTMILITFLAGLLPVIGNLISNTVIVIISLTHSIEAAIGSLVFLIVIHKLEYFFNAHIVGSRIQASAWELLSAMLVMQAVFGWPGIIAAPIFYAYFKSELSSRSWI